MVSATTSRSESPAITSSSVTVVTLAPMRMAVERLIDPVPDVRHVLPQRLRDRLVRVDPTLKAYEPDHDADRRDRHHDRVPKLNVHLAPGLLSAYARASDPRVPSGK